MPLLVSHVTLNGVTVTRQSGKIINHPYGRVDAFELSQSWKMSTGQFPNIYEISTPFFGIVNMKYSRKGKDHTRTVQGTDHYLSESINNKENIRNRWK